MSQINVNSGPPVDQGERASSAGFGMIAVILAVIVALVVMWLLLSGLFSGPGPSTTNVNVNPPSQSQPAQKDGPSVNINVPKVEVNPSNQQPAAPAKP
jgi:hypothetical protein